MPRMGLLIRNMPDLRKKYDRRVRVKDGWLYQRRAIVQVWWERREDGTAFVPATAGRETWSLDDGDWGITESSRNFEFMAERWGCSAAKLRNQMKIRIDV
jgi:hypothetical protein